MQFDVEFFFKEYIFLFKACFEILNSCFDVDFELLLLTPKNGVDVHRIKMWTTKCEVIFGVLIARPILLEF